MPHICDWRHNYLIGSWLRRLFHPPARLLSGYLRPGMIVLDAGCGMGLYSLPMAAMVGETGKVIAVDLQPENLEVLMSRARKIGLAGRIEPVACDMGVLPVQEKIDFALAFYSVHEVPEQGRFFRRAAQLLAPQGYLLVVEPKFHVNGKAFEQTLAEARQAGLNPVGRPGILASYTALLEK